MAGTLFIVLNALYRCRGTSGPGIHGHSPRHSHIMHTSCARHSRALTGTHTSCTRHAPGTHTVQTRQPHCAHQIRARHGHTPPFENWQQFWATSKYADRRGTAALIAQKSALCARIRQKQVTGADAAIKTGVSSGYTCRKLTGKPERLPGKAYSSSQESSSSTV